MLTSGDELILSLAKLLAGKQMDSGVINQALALLCRSFAFETGLLYEIDQHNDFILKERLAADGAVLHSSFATNCIEAGYRRQLAQQTVVQLSRSEQNSEQETMLLQYFDAAALALIAIVDENTRINGFIIFTSKKQPGVLSGPDLQTLRTTLTMLGGYVGLRVYQNRFTFAKNSLESILDNTGIDIYVNDFYNHDILYINKSMAVPYGGIEQFMGRKCWEVLFPGQGGECEFCPQKKLVNENGEPTKIYSWDYQRPFDGSWFRVFSAAFRWVDGRLAHVVSSADITDNKRNEALVEYMASYDSLTGLPNRRMLVKDCAHRIGHAQAGEAGYVMFFDIDGFKLINDNLGHSSGDEFLVQLGQFFAGIPLLKDAIYRNGGDEFVALIDGDKTEANIRSLAGFIQRRFKQPWHLRAQDVFCGASIGVARYPDDGQTPEVLLQKADQAMYRVKKAGGSGVLFCYEL